VLEVSSLSLSFSLFLSVSLSFSDYLPTYPTDLSTYLSVCLSIYLSIHPSIHPSIHRSIDRSISLSLSLSNPHVLLILDKVHNPLRLPRETTSEPPKVRRTCGVLYMFTSTCASRHNGVHFFHIGISKSGANMCCFVHLHFHFEICFSPQRRALFRHRNCQKWRVHVVLCTFSLPNVLLATTACTFFDISASKSGPRMVCFVHFDFEMCFAPQRRALFRHLNCQKWSAPGVFCTF